MSHPNKHVIAPPKRFVFRGRSLAFVRSLLGRRAPLASSALQMALACSGRMVKDPVIGMVCFWGDTEPGDCGVYVGDGLVLCLDSSGHPRVAPLSQVASKNFLGACFWPDDIRRI